MKKPTIEQVRAFKAEINDDLVDADLFWYHYQENGWMKGSGKKERPMRDWKLTYHTWKRREMASRKDTQGKQSIKNYVEGLL